MVNAQLGLSYELTQTIANIQRQLTALATQPILLNASTGQDGGKGLTTDKDGLHVFNPAGKEAARLQTVDGALVMFNDAGAEIARFGLLTHTTPGAYGAEVLVGASWVKLGDQAITWANVGSKPATFPPSAHTHVGADVTSGAVPEAEGSQYGWTNNVAGTEFYALWVGNNAGYKFGRNVSSVRYKMNIRAHHTDPAKVLNLTPVLYDRIPIPPLAATTDEYGLIAEQVAQHCPELVTWFNGEIDSVRYDLLGVALLPVVKHQDAQIKALAAALQTLIPGFTLPAPSPVAANVPSSMAPPVQPAPLPYTIQPQPGAAP
ncbi:tail fiber domain-containing protein [Pseudarthrobacter cellobiosi]|uniref:tail fiber domain-containing protein n=1 Tax=Pseudarthrobacter cellobiosi TaxID=2953654 RepID=UPI00208E3321|nr:tail fiber domain-containing protein [Pseudarthrobacter sp. HLT1-5]MCO4257420.1 tail fiber domain-containing protein [Pseudarthrobacter sp. HLT1-5]